jgi:HSP20 family protein
MASRFFGPGSGLVSVANNPFSLLEREVGRVFDEVLRGFPAASRGAAAMGGFAPNLEVRETESGLDISAELPGMSEEDIELRLEGDLLTISGEKKEERTENQGGLHLTERSFGRFQRAFRLPFNADPAQVRAEFDRGILRISLPRPQKQQQGGRIQIQAGAKGVGPGEAQPGTQPASQHPAGTNGASGEAQGSSPGA